MLIRLPKAALASLEVREGDPVDLIIEGDALVARASRPRYTLEELVAAMRPEDEPESIDDVEAPRWAMSCCSRVDEARRNVSLPPIAARYSFHGRFRKRAHIC